MHGDIITIADIVAAGVRHLRPETAYLRRPFSLLYCEIEYGRSIVVFLRCGCFRFAIPSASFH